MQLASELVPFLFSQVALESFFRQSVEDVNRGHVATEDKLYRLKALQDAGKKVEVRVLPCSCRSCSFYISFFCKFLSNVLPFLSFDGPLEFF